MLILVGVTINVALNGGLFDTARDAAKQEERELIHDQIVSAIKIREGGKLDVKGTYEDAKAILTSQGKTVALVEPTSEAEITDSTTSVIFTVTGKYGTFKYQITDTEIKLIGEVTEEDNNEGDNPEIDDPVIDEPIVPETYLTSIEGLGTGVSLVQYENLTGNLKTAADNGKIKAVLTENTTINGVATTLTAVIPTGFTVSTEKTTEADTITGGLVVTDGSNNEFVWIPVPEINDMVMCQSAGTVPTGAENGTCTIELDGETLKCTKHNSEALAGRLYADTTIASSGENFNASLTGQTYNATSGYREPANLTGTKTLSETDVGTTGVTPGTYAYDSQEMFTVYGGGTFTDSYQAEFNAMAKSVKKYGGFYVGRYETGGFNESTVVSQPNRGKTSGDINNTTWYKMYTMQKAFGNEIVGSSMIWGCQYDQVMKFVDGKNSFNVKTAVAGRHSGSSTTGTGNTPADFVANIYDLEGNMWEWTLEAINTYNRVYRGGSYNSYSASYRNTINYPYSSNGNRGSRFTLYVQ